MSYSPLELAEAFIKAGELNDALDALNEYLIATPNDDAARRLRVSVRQRLNTPDAIRAALDDLGALDMQPMDHYTRSVLLEQLTPESLDDALSAAKSAFAQSDDDWTHSRALGRVLDLMRKAGKLDEALKLALEHDWVGWAAEAAAEMEDSAAALGYYNEALDRAAGLDTVTSPAIAANIRARIRLKRAGVLVKLGKLDEADADYTVAAEVVPDDPMIPFNRGVLAYRRGDHTAAKSLFQSGYKRANKTLRSLMRDEIQDNAALHDLWKAATDTTP